MDPDNKAKMYWKDGFGYGDVGGGDDFYKCLAIYALNEEEFRHIFVIAACESRGQITGCAPNFSGQ